MSSKAELALGQFLLGSSCLDSLLAAEHLSESLHPFPAQSQVFHGSDAPDKAQLGPTTSRAQGGHRDKDKGHPTKFEIIILAQHKQPNSD